MLGIKHFAILALATGLLLGCELDDDKIDDAKEKVKRETTLTDERRAKINGCLAEIGKDPLPERLSGINAPMNADELKIFKRCMES